MVVGLAQKTDAEQAYIPVSAAALIPETCINTSLYICQQTGGEMQLYRGPQVPIEQADLDNLVARGHSRLFVRADEHAQYQQYLRDNLSSFLGDESLPVKRRFASLNEVVRDVLATSFSEGEIDGTVDTCRELATHIGKHPQSVSSDCDLHVPIRTR